MNVFGNIIDDLARLGKPFAKEPINPDNSRGEVAAATRKWPMKL
jgi:hypothetical protein